MRLREAKRRDALERGIDRHYEVLIRSGMMTLEQAQRERGGEWRDPRRGCRYDEAKRKLIESPRAKIPNTNEWRFAQAKVAHERHWARRRRQPKTPLITIGTFLHQIAPYTDLNATLSVTDQRLAGCPPWSITPQYARIHTAWPAVPQHQLEAAWLHVEARLRRITSNNARSRATSAWLGRWSRVFEAELVRRDRGFEFPRADHLAMIEQRERKRFAEVSASYPVIEFEQMEPQATMWPVEF